MYTDKPLYLQVSLFIHPFYYVLLDVLLELICLSPLHLCVKCQARKVRQIDIALQKKYLSTFKSLYFRLTRKQNPHCFSGNEFA